MLRPVILFCFASTLFSVYTGADFSVVVVAGHNSASTFLMQLFNEAAVVLESVFYSSNIQQNYSDLELLSLFEADKSPRKMLVPLRDMYFEELTKSNNTNVVVHFRDPRDVLISRYYSFGWTHLLPPKSSPHHAAIKAERARIRAMTLDEFVLQSYDTEVIRLELLIEFLESRNIANTLVSQYKDMMLHFKDWFYRIFRFIAVPDNVIVTLHEQESPRFSGLTSTTPRDVTKLALSEEEQMNPLVTKKYHVRDPSPNQYLTRLSPSTNEFLKEKFEPLLVKLQRFV